MSFSLKSKVERRGWHFIYFTYANCLRGRTARFSFLSNKDLFRSTVNAKQQLEKMSADAGLIHLNAIFWYIYKKLSHVSVFLAYFSKKHLILPTDPKFYPHVCLMYAFIGLTLSCKMYLGFLRFIQVSCSFHLAIRSLW